MATKKHQMPKILMEIVALLKYKRPDIARTCIVNGLIAYASQMICAKQVKFDECGKTNIPNWYALNFAPSGRGKDWIKNQFDDVFFRPFEDWYIEQANNIYETLYLEFETGMPTNSGVTHSKGSEVPSECAF